MWGLGEDTGDVGMKREVLLGEDGEVFGDDGCEGEGEEDFCVFFDQAHGGFLDVKV